MHTPIKTWLGVTIIIIMALSAGMFIWYQQKNLAVDGQTATTKPGAKQKECTAEAKLCPDGSAVGRTGPNCEFAPCPGENKNADTSNWQTYRNEKYGFELKVPKEWEAKNERKLKYFDEGGNIDLSDKIGQISIEFSPNDNKEDYLYLASMGILITPTKNLELCSGTPLCSPGEKIAEKDGYTFSYTYALDGGSDYVDLDNSSDKYKEYNKKKTEIIDAVIKTFKFTN